MAKRFAVGLLKGVVVGVLLALAWGKVMGPVALDGALAYVAAGLTGALSGLLAGKPFWARGALIEASLKGLVGALFAAAALYGIRKWLHFDLQVGPVTGGFGFAPLLTLPAIAALLGVMFELDNTGTDLATDKTARVAPNKVTAGDAAELEADELGSTIEPRLHRKG